MKLSIIVPVYNEEKTIARVLQKLISIKLPCEREIIVVDDGSKDMTVSEIKSVKNIRLISHKKNAGKGVAVRTGIGESRGDYILIQDADFEYNPEEIPELLRPIMKSSQHIAVYGSRFARNDAVIPRLYLFGNKFLTLLTNMLYGTRLTDMETGYKLLPAHFVKRIHISANHFDFEPEVTAKLVRNGIKIVEVPIKYHGRTHGAGKKLTAMDAFEAIRALFYYRFFD